jgi:hypothetical protein
MKWKRCDIEGIQGIAVAAHDFQRPRWWQLWEWLVEFWRFLISGVNIYVQVPRMVAERGYYIGYKSPKICAGCGTEILHHKEFLLTAAGPSACTLFALDGEGNEVQIKDARRMVSVHQNVSKLPFVSL